MFAAYNAWWNERLYDAVAQVTEWMQHFTGQGEAPLTLDAILYDDFGQLRAGHRAEDERISRSIGSLNEADLAGAIRYCTVSKLTNFEQPL